MTVLAFTCHSAWQYLAEAHPQLTEKKSPGRADIGSIRSPHCPYLKHAPAWHIFAAVLMGRMAKAGSCATRFSFHRAMGERLRRLRGMFGRRSQSTLPNATSKRAPKKMPNRASALQSAIQFPLLAYSPIWLR